MDVWNRDLLGRSEDNIGFLNSWRYGFRESGRAGGGLGVGLLEQVREWGGDGFLWWMVLDFAEKVRSPGSGTCELLVGFWGLNEDRSDLREGLKTLFNEIDFLIGLVDFSCKEEISCNFPILTGFTFIPYSRFFKFFSRDLSLLFLMIKV